MTNATNAPAQDAQWLAHRYDPQHDAIHFRPVSRAGHDAAPFLTDEYLGPADPVIIGRAEIMAQPMAQGPLHFIFHSAYCCSTLLARAMNLPGIAMGLKEPVILNDIVGWRQRGADGRQAAMVLDHAMRLMARPFAPGEAVIVKPSNVVNPLIPAMLALRRDSRALLLHAPLDAYLASITRKGMWGRLWVRDLFQKLAREGMIAPLGIEPCDYLGLTDIQVAALGWLAQQWQFQRLTRQFGDRVATLNSETLIARPADCVAATARLFALHLDREAVAAVVDGPVFASDAKRGESFGRDQRAQTARTAINLHGEEVEKVAQWAMVIANNAEIAMDLPQALNGPA